jgi:hypothetical protein
VLHTSFTVHQTPFVVHHTPREGYQTSFTVLHTSLTVHHTPFVVHHTPREGEQTESINEGKKTVENRRVWIELYPIRPALRQAQGPDGKPAAQPEAMQSEEVFFFNTPHPTDAAHRNNCLTFGRL